MFELFTLMSTLLKRDSRFESYWVEAHTQAVSTWNDCSESVYAACL